VLSRLRELVERSVRSLLVLDPDPRGQAEILELVASTDVDVTGVATTADALDALSRRSFDCMVVSLRGNEPAALDTLRRMAAEANQRSLPVVVYGAGDGSAPVEAELEKLGAALVLRHARSPERLLDETALFLHRDAAGLPAAQQAIVRRLHSSIEVLAGRTVLVVDDDVRNVFALTSLLERHGMQVISAENGREALGRLQHAPAVDVVLMDVMLPEMDGYETTRAIRRLPEYRSLPILALTAKAMKGDREKCLEAGASDYIAKPVEADHLVAQLRRWLHR
jgi:CheY-like chemotaxis protein